MAHRVYSLFIVHVHIVHIIHIRLSSSLLLLVLLLLILIEQFLLLILLLKERLLGKLLRLLQTIGNNNIVKERPRFDLPQFEADVRTRTFAHGVHFLVVLILGIGDHGMFPRPLVVGIIDHFRFPLPLVVGIVDHRWFPFAVVLVVPIVRFGGVRIGNFRGNVVVALRFDVVGVRDLFVVHPVFGFGLIWILDFFGQEEIEFVFQLARTNGLVVDEYVEGVVGFDDEGVEVTELIVFRVDFFVYQEVVVLLVGVEDDVSAFVGGAADVGPEHDAVGRVAAELVGVEGGSAREELDVGPAAVDLLLVLDGVLDDEVLLVGAVEGGGERGGEAVEAGVLGGFDALVVGRAAVEFADGVGPGSQFGGRLPVGGHGPSFFPSLEFFFHCRVSVNKDEETRCVS